MMKCSRPILGFKSLKYSTNKIMNLLNWNTIYQMIIKESILFIHKRVYDNQACAITQFYTYSLNTKNNIRSVRKPIIREIPNSNRVKQTLLHKGLYLYNPLPDDLKFKNPKLLSKHLQNYIRNYFPSDRIDRFDPG